MENTQAWEQRFLIAWRSRLQDSSSASFHVYFKFFPGKILVSADFSSFRWSQARLCFHSCSLDHKPLSAQILHSETKKKKKKTLQFWNRHICVDCVNTVEGEWQFSGQFFPSVSLAWSQFMITLNNKAVLKFHAWEFRREKGTLEGITPKYYPFFFSLQLSSSPALLLLFQC